MSSSFNLEVEGNYIVISAACLLSPWISLAGVAIGCILAVADQRRVKDDELDKMEATNGDGAGIAWREKSHPDLEFPDIVRWEKGLSLEEIKVFNTEVPLPYVVHFRIASVGQKIPELTHPFPVEKEMRQVLTGATKGFVMFHNGTWGSWKDKGFDWALHCKERVPEGPWSDTRVMAWLAFHKGHGILNFLDEKIILFGPRRIEIFRPDLWFRVDDLLVSNRVWEHHQPQTKWQGYGNGYNYEGQGTICRMAMCDQESLPGTWYCAEHQPVCRHYDCHAPRVAGTECCAEHQPFCQTIGCNKPRVAMEKFCSAHMPPAALAPAVLSNPVLQEQSRWARAINPKAVRTNGQPVM